MKASASRKVGGLTMMNLMIVIMVSFFMTDGCAEVKLGTLPTPPPPTGLRVFFKFVTNDSGQPADIIEKLSYMMVGQIFLLNSIAYEIVPLEEVLLIEGKDKLPYWQWDAKFLLVNVKTNSRFQVNSFIPSNKTSLNTNIKETLAQLEKMEKKSQNRVKCQSSLPGILPKESGANSCS